MVSIEKFNISPRKLASIECMAFKLQDEKKYDLSAKFFYKIYREIFNDISANDSMLAAKYYVEALKIKDIIDQEYLDVESRSRDSRWSDVENAFKNFCKKLKINSQFAVHNTLCWKNHKICGDYISEGISAQKIFVKRLLQNNKKWYEKKKDGLNGPGPLPFLYLVAVEAHDLHTNQAWELVEDVMTLYYKIILDGRTENV